MTVVHGGSGSFVGRHHALCSSYCSYLHGHDCENVMGRTPVYGEAILCLLLWRSFSLDTSRPVCVWEGIVEGEAAKAKWRWDDDEMMCMRMMNKTGIFLLHLSSFSRLIRVMMPTRQTGENGSQETIRGEEREVEERRRATRSLEISHCLYFTKCGLLFPVKALVCYAIGRSEWHRAYLTLSPLFSTPSERTTYRDI